MRATHRKVQGHQSFYGTVIVEGRPVWMCGHNHPTRKKANACARGQVRSLPRTGPAALRMLQRTWTPHGTEYPTDAGGRPVLRRSYVEAFLQCVQYQGADSPDASFGSVVHDAIHAYWQLCIATGEESRMTDIERLVREAFFRNAGADVNRYSEAQRLVVDFCSSRLLEAHRLLVLGRRPVIEFTLQADIGWAVLTGTVDRIDRMDADDPDDPPSIIRIRDYKSGFAPDGGRAIDQANGAVLLPEESHLVPHEFQRRFYAMLAFLDPRLGSQLIEVQTEIDYMRYHGVPEVVSYTREELEEWWHGVTWALTDRWQKRTQPPTGCASCEHCSLRRGCGAALVEAREVPFDLVGAVELAQQLIRTRAVSDSQRASLQSYLKFHDPIQVNGLEVGYLRPRAAQWKVKDPMKVVAQLNAHGLAGESTLVTWVAEDKVPRELQPMLVESGAATYELGPPTFKVRKRGED